jgi:hypothetical protein
MPDPQIVTGDSRPYTISLTIDGEPFVITSGVDTVKAALVSLDRKTVLAAATSLSSTTPGSDWAASKVVYKPGRSDTASLTVQGPALVEVQVSFGGTDDWTWFIPVNLIKGNVT